MVQAEVRWLEESLIDPNPWQPRSDMSDESIEKLATSIDQDTLLQEPLGREAEGGRVQTAFGHRRIAAVRLLIRRDRWQHGTAVPMKISPISDEQMAMYALTENTEREDISRSDELRAYQKALDEISGLTIQELARRVKLDRTTLSKNLAVLQLPDSVIAYVHDGRLSVRAARELLALRSDTHTHEDQMQMVLNACEPNYYFYREVPDYTVKNVRLCIHGLTQGSTGSRGVDTSKLWRPLVSGTTQSDPGFDIQRFRRDYANDIHLVPAGFGTRGELWTCNVREWRKRQTAATNAADAEKKQDGDPPQTKRAGPSERWLDAVKRDPVVQSIIGSDRAAEIKDIADLTAEEREKLGSRITKPESSTHYEARNAVHGLPREVGPEWLGQVKAEEPPMFDFSECRNCTIGAGWAETEYGSAPQLVCFNDKLWQEKRAAGIERFTRWRDETLQRESDVDLRMADRFAFTVPADLARALVLSERGWLARPREVSPYHWEYRKADYYPAPAIELAKMIGVNLPSLHNGSWTEDERWRQSIEAFFENPPDDFDWPRAAGLLVLWKARVAYGLGGQLPEVADDVAANGNGDVPGPVTIDGRPAEEVLFERLPRGGAALRLLGFVIEHARDPGGLKGRLPKTTYGDQVRGLERYGITLDQVGVGHRGPGHGQVRDKIA